MRVGGRERLMAMEAGRNPTPFVQTREETRAPLALFGPDKVLFLLGGSSNPVVATASVASGQIVDRLESIPALATRRMSLAGSPDGKTVYYLDSGIVWALPLGGGEARKIGEGDGVAIDPSGAYLVIQANKVEGPTLVRLQLASGASQVIKTSSRYPLTSALIAPNAIRADGRIAVAVNPIDSWYWPAGILDPETGEIELATEHLADMFSPGWDREGRLVTVARFIRAGLWRFRPEK